MKALLWCRNLMNRMSVRFNRKITGKRSWLWIASSAIIFIVIVFFSELKKNGCEDKWQYLYTALKISAPSEDLKGEGSHKWAYLWMGIAATLLIPFFTAAIQTGINNSVLKRKEGRKIFHLMCNHYVMIGYNRYSSRIIEQLLKGNRTYIIVMTAQNPMKIRENIENELSSNITKRIIIYAGDALQQEKIDNLKLPLAEKLFLLDESEPRSSQYSRNLSVLKNITEAVLERTNPLEVYMQINNFKAYNLMQRVDIPQDSFANKKGDIVVDFRPFNFYENWARLLWSFHKLPQYDTLDFESLEGTDKHVHLVISGFNSMGRALLLEALRLCHYPNFDEKTGMNKTIITIFDSRWTEMKDIFYAQYPLSHLQQIIDVELDFQDMDINSDTARSQLEQWACDEKQLLTISLCDKDQDIAMTKALNLPEKIFRSNVRVLVRQEIDKVNEDVFANDNKRVYPHLYFFGMLPEGVDMRLLDDRLAICINGIYDFYQEKALDLSDTQNSFECRNKIRAVLTRENETSWKIDWLSKSQTDKWSNRFLSDMFKTYVAIWNRHSGLSSKEFFIWQEILADMEHRRWIAERTVYGFRQKQGEENKDKRMKIHVDIKPYAELEDSIRNYDRNIVNTSPILVEEMMKLNDYNC